MISYHVRIAATFLGGSGWAADTLLGGIGREAAV